MSNDLIPSLTTIDPGTSQADRLIAEGSKTAPMQSEAEVRKAAKEFESYFLSYMLKTMRETVDKTGLLGEKSRGEEIFQSMLDDETAKNMADAGGIGLADMIVEQLQSHGLVQGADQQAQHPVIGSVLNDPLAAPYTAPGRAASHGFAMPVEGVVTSGFGIRKDPFTGLEEFHKGVDIAAGRDTPIHAAADGTVIFSGPSTGGYGNLVIIEHPDGVKSYYGHTDKVLVSRGRQVRQGDTIALMGSTGRSTGTHLHFEIRKAGVSVNPFSYVNSALVHK